jgi:hypothetical protein
MVLSDIPSKIIPSGCGEPSPPNLQKKFAINVYYKMYM